MLLSHLLDYPERKGLSVANMLYAKLHMYMVMYYWDRIVDILSDYMAQQYGVGQCVIELNWVAQGQTVYHGPFSMVCDVALMWDRSKTG